MNGKRVAIAGAGLLAAAGLAIGAASLANAESPSGLASDPGQPGYGHVAPDGKGAPNGNTDPSKPMRSDEQLLTGDTAAKVTAAAKAKEPDATIERVETDSDGVYEAHMVRADGTHIIVQVDANFTVTNVLEGGQGRGPGGGAGDGRAPDAPEGGGSTSTPSATPAT
jgi:hypothetical protein